MLKIIVRAINIFCVIGLVRSDLDATFHHCCSLGRNKTLDPLKCGAKIRTPIVKVAIEEQSLCLSTADLCCFQTLRDKSCRNGQRVAKSGQSCAIEFRTEEDLTFKYCCEACKVGMIAGSLSMCNTKSFKFDPPWDQVYKSCCEEPTTTSLDFLSETNTETTNICDMFRGELCDHICNPVNGSYHCQCRPGFSLLADGKSCREEIGNRCERNNPCDQECFDNGTSIECSCNVGFILLNDRVSCEDIDECREGSHACNLKTHACVNYAGGYRCELNKKFPVTIPGFIFDSATNNTTDIDECSSQPCKDHEICVNTVGSFRCDCIIGFLWNSTSISCSDVDECDNGVHQCPPSSMCVNTVGSYRCVSRKNVNFSSSFPAKSTPGYLFDPLTNKMNDINECESNPCNSNEVCLNSIGSFKCNCASGFQRDRITDACVDINECQTKQHDCNLISQRCDNTIGSYHCVRFTGCGTGYTFNSESLVCEDDDECSLGTHDCQTLGPDYECQNGLGSFRCVKKQCANSSICLNATSQLPKCAAGYAVVKGQCVDVNECANFNACSRGFNCQNTPGSFRCISSISCGVGFRSSDVDNRCIDINECVEQAKVCDHVCINTHGSFRCTCNQGFLLHRDNRSCVDVNECELYKNRRLCAAYCVNEPGSYKCTCPEGYKLGSDGASCIDIDECVDQNKCKQPHEICLNIRGSYRCNAIICPTNYVQEADRRNRCTRAPYFCNLNDETCSKMPLSYSFNYITFGSNVPLPITGQQELFHMRGPTSGTSSISFSLELKSVTAPLGIPKVSLNNFYLNHTSPNSVTVSLVKSITGPQEIELNLLMHVHVNGVYSGFTVSKLFIFVSQYDF